MLSTVNQLKEQTKEDVGIYHHVDGCYTILGPVPDGLTLGTPAFTAEGHTLLLRAVAHSDAPSVAYELKFKTTDVILLEQPEATPKPAKKTKRKAAPVEQDITDVDDTDVDSMT